jgi:hypothetical protein
LEPIGKEETEEIYKTRLKCSNNLCLHQYDIARDLHLMIIENEIRVLFKIINK